MHYDFPRYIHNKAALAFDDAPSSALISKLKLRRHTLLSFTCQLPYQENTGRYMRLTVAHNGAGVGGL